MAYSLFELFPFSLEHFDLLSNLTGVLTAVNHNIIMLNTLISISLVTKP